MTTVDPLGLLSPLPRRSRRWLVIGLAAAALVIVSGGAALAFGLRSDHPATVTPSPSPPKPVIFPTAAAAAPPLVATTPAVAPEIQQACDLNDRLDPTADLPGLRPTVNKIQQLVANSDSFEVRFAGNMLKDRYDLAIAAQRYDNALSTAIEFMTAHIQLSTACIKAGWRQG